MLWVAAGARSEGKDRIGVMAGCRGWGVTEGKAVGEVQPSTSTEFQTQRQTCRGERKRELVQTRDDGEKERELPRQTQDCDPGHRAELQVSLHVGTLGPKPKSMF